MSIKMLREHLCADQAKWQTEWPENIRTAVSELIKMIDRCRPTGPDGKHGSLHTTSCGCEDLDVARVLAATQELGTEVIALRDQVSARDAVIRQFGWSIREVKP